jgi:hypothetical protein
MIRMIPSQSFQNSKMIPMMMRTPPIATCFSSLAGNEEASLRHFVLPILPTALIYKFPRSACSRSIASNNALKLPSPNPREP